MATPASARSIYVKVFNGNVDMALRRMKTQMIKEGLVTRLRYGRFHEKKGIKRRRLAAQNENRAKKKMLRGILRRINQLRQREM